MFQNIENKNLRTFLEWIEIIVIALIITFIIKAFIGEVTVVVGSSMHPTLETGDRLVVNRIGYLLGEPKKGDVITFKYSKDSNYIKRVIGVPGDSINIHDKKVFVNGKELDESYIAEKTLSGGDFEYPVKVTEDHYFVMGDNRNNSKDSRRRTVGLVDKKAIRGKAFLRIWPFNRVGIIK